MLSCLLSGVKPVSGIITRSRGQANTDGSREVKAATEECKYMHTMSYLFVVHDKQVYA